MIFHANKEITVADFLNATKKAEFVFSVNEMHGWKLASTSKKGYKSLDLLKNGQLSSCEPDDPQLISPKCSDHYS